MARMPHEDIERAANAYLLLVRGLDATEIAARAEIADATTVRNFLVHRTSWPNIGTRRKLAALAGIDEGDLGLYAKGLKNVDTADQDPVIAAIRISKLTARNRRALEKEYLDMLEDQQEEAG